MMKRAISILAISAGVALAFPASGIDGKWLSESKVTTKKRGEQTVKTEFELKTGGNQLTGTVLMGRNKRAASVEIKDGKIEGDRFSFTTVQNTRNGENKMKWEGTLQGDQLQGTMTREGARRGASFTAKRTN